MKDESKFSAASKRVGGYGLCLKWGAEEDVLGSAHRDYMVKTENLYQGLGIARCLISDELHLAR